MDMMLMRQTGAKSRRQRPITVSQIDWIDDRQNEKTKTKTKQTNPPPRTGKCEQNILTSPLTSPLDQILDAQSKPLDESFISRLPSQVPHILYLDAGEATCFLGNDNTIQGQGHTIPGEGNLIRGQGSNIPWQGSRIPYHMMSRIGMTPAQVGVVRGQVDKIPRQTSITTGQIYSDRLFQGGNISTMVYWNVGRWV